MLLWVTLLAGLLVVASILLIITMFRAERRARRRLFEALGLSDETIELLMSRNGDVQTELSLVRISPPATRHVDAAERTLLAPSRKGPPHRHPPIRLVHPVVDEPDLPPDQPGANAKRHRGL